MTTRERLHQLVDQLPEGDVATAARVLEALRDTGDPVLRLLEEAPFDDEPLTPEDEEAIREGKEAYRRGEGIPLRDVFRQLQD